MTNPSHDLRQQVEAESVANDERLAWLAKFWAGKYHSALSAVRVGNQQAWAEFIAHIDSIITARVAAARQEAADICGAIYQDHRDQYKGRGKWASQDNPRRADPHADGASDGASECEDAILALAASQAAPSDMSKNASKMNTSGERVDLVDVSQAAPAKAEGWISCAERLPEADVDVLVYWTRNESGRFDIAGIFDGRWQSAITESETKGEVDRWMPLPKLSTPAKEPTV